MTVIYGLRDKPGACSDHNNWEQVILLFAYGFCLLKAEFIIVKLTCDCLQDLETTKEDRKLFSDDIRCDHLTGNLVIDNSQKQ